jgi:hypothetical protein
VLGKQVGERLVGKRLQVLAAIARKQIERLHVWVSKAISLRLAAMASVSP